MTRRYFEGSALPLCPAFRVVPWPIFGGWPDAPLFDPQQAFFPVPERFNCGGCDVCFLARRVDRLTEETLHDDCLADRIARWQSVFGIPLRDLVIFEELHDE